MSFHRLFPDFDMDGLFSFPNLNFIDKNNRNYYKTTTFQSKYENGKFEEQRQYKDSSGVKKESKYRELSDGRSMYYSFDNEDSLKDNNMKPRISRKFKGVNSEKEFENAWNKPKALEGNRLDSLKVLEPKFKFKKGDKVTNGREVTGVVVRKEPEKTGWFYYVNGKDEYGRGCTHYIQEKDLVSNENRKFKVDDDVKYENKYGKVLEVEYDSGWVYYIEFKDDNGKYVKCLEEKKLEKVDEKMFELYKLEEQKRKLEEKISKIKGKRCIKEVPKCNFQ